MFMCWRGCNYVCWVLVLSGATRGDIMLPCYSMHSHYVLGRYYIPSIPSRQLVFK